MVRGQSLVECGFQDGHSKIAHPAPCIVWSATPCIEKWGLCFLPMNLGSPLAMVELMLWVIRCNVLKISAACSRMSWNARYWKQPSLWGSSSHRERSHGDVLVHSLRWGLQSQCQLPDMPVGKPWWDIQYQPLSDAATWASWAKTAQFSSVQFSPSVMSDSLRPHESQHARSPCPSPTPRVYSNSCPSSWWCHPAISSSVVPFSSCPQSLPALGSFPVSQLFASDGQNIGVSASTSVLPMNTRDWSRLGWTGWFSLQSKGLSRVFSNTTVQKHHSLALSFLHSPTLTSIHDHWKNHSLDYMDLCWLSSAQTALRTWEIRRNVVVVSYYIWSACLHSDR